MSDLTPAPKGYPIKLVRDATASIVNHSGEPGALFYGPIPLEDQPRWLRRKLLEEVGEYLESGELAELADVLAVVVGLSHVAHGVSLEDLSTAMSQDARGGFATGQMMYGHHPEFDGF